MIFRSICAVALCALPTLGLAVTECTGRAIRVWTGDEGTVWVVMDTGANWYVGPSDPDTKNILATVTAALISDRSITVRFSADGASCVGGIRGDVVGMWLHSM